jgi:hypothetical protein
LWLIRVEKSPEEPDGFSRYEPCSSTLITNIQKEVDKRISSKQLEIYFLRKSYKQRKEKKRK